MTSLEQAAPARLSASGNGMTEEERMAMEARFEKDGQAVSVVHTRRKALPACV